MSGQSDSGARDDSVKAFLASVVITEDNITNTSWESVIGLHEAKEKLKELIILPAKFRQLFTGARKPQSSGILLYGPPGTGKTLLARAVLTELISTDTLCLSFSVYDLLTKWQGDPISNIRGVFEKARACKYTVIFLDDADALGQHRADQEESEGWKKIKADFLAQAMKFRVIPECMMTIVGVTNRPWYLAGDPQLLRFFDRRFYTPMPDSEERKAIFKHILTVNNLHHTLTEEDFIVLGEKTGHLTGSDISVVIRDACMQFPREIQKATHFKKVVIKDERDQDVERVQYMPCSPEEPDAIEMVWTQIPETQFKEPKLTMVDFTKSLSSQRPSITPEEIDRYKSFLEDWGME